MNTSTHQKHTAGPLRTYHYLGNRLTIRQEISDDDLVEINYPNNKKEIGEANAAFIVRACNSHYEMLEACKNALAYYNQRGRSFSTVATHLAQLISKAEGRG